MTKLNKLNFKSREDQQAEYLRRMFLAMSNDIRVVIIKLADRLHNMRTLAFRNEADQKRIATETLDIYAPIAARLGIAGLKGELEDLCLRYLHPEDYYMIARKGRVHARREAKGRRRDLRRPAQDARRAGHKGRHQRQTQALLQHLAQDAKGQEL